MPCRNLLNLCNYINWPDLIFSLFFFYLFKWLCNQIFIPTLVICQFEMERIYLIWFDTGPNLVILQEIGLVVLCISVRQVDFVDKLSCLYHVQDNLLLIVDSIFRTPKIRDKCRTNSRIRTEFQRQLYLTCKGFFYSNMLSNDYVWLNEKLYEQKSIKDVKISVWFWVSPELLIWIDRWKIYISQFYCCLLLIFEYL